MTAILEKIIQRDKKIVGESSRIVMHSQQPWRDSVVSISPLWKQGNVPLFFQKDFRLQGRKSETLPPED